MPTQYLLYFFINCLFELIKEPSVVIFVVYDYPSLVSSDWNWWRTTDLGKAILLNLMAWANRILSFEVSNEPMKQLSEL